MTAADDAGRLDLDAVEARADVPRWQELTTSESLMVEVLIARLRLGEQLWTFENRTARQANALLAKGFAREVKSGVTEGSIRVFPSVALLAWIEANPYTSPVDAELRAAREAEARVRAVCATYDAPGAPTGGWPIPAARILAALDGTS